MHDRLIQLSKYLAKYLRHAPHELGLALQPGGWVPVDDLLAAARKHGFPISYDDLMECVETNDKQRFAFDVSGELIRANQGHSVEVDLQLEERDPPEKLSIGDGDTALTRFAQMARGEIGGLQVESTRQQLLEYCELDTLAIVRLHDKLLGLAGDSQRRPSAN
jgi:putative RNA 2'-phosphotransferase